MTTGGRGPSNTTLGLILIGLVLLILGLASVLVSGGIRPTS